MPEWRLQPSSSSNRELLLKLESEKKIVFTPCKRLPGRNVTSYDDRLILDFAHEHDAVVISNDNFRDIRSESKGTEMDVLLVK